MKTIIKAYHNITGLLFFVLLIGNPAPACSQEEAEEQKTKESKPVKNTFESTFLFDNQTTLVPAKGTLDMAIQHRFGTVNNGYDDLYGIYAPSNIRIGFSYSPIQKLNIGFGFTKLNLSWDLSGKLALLQQMKGGGSPVSITYYGNAAVDTRKKENFVNETDRLSYFNQLIFSSKITNALSVQAAPSWSHFNAVEGYLNEQGEIEGKIENDHFAVAFGGRYKISNSIALIANYDQPITEHKTNNPHPNLSFGIELSTSAHAFQIFAGNYSNILPQYNNVYNKNDFTNGEFLIGFNITRLWSF